MSHLFFAPGLSRCCQFGYPFLLAVLLLVAAGCDNSKPAEKDAASAPLKKAGKAPLELPLRVRVVVPYSGNMPGLMGYRATMGVNTEFQARIGGLLKEVHSSPQVSQAAFYLIDQQGAMNAVHFDTLRGRINGTGRRTYGTGLGVAQVFRAVLNEPDTGQVVRVLVTDLTDHSASRRNLAALEDDVTSALADLRRLGLGAVVYADSSRFYGTFYPAFQQPPRGQEVRGSFRPYYIWVIGAPALVRRFQREVWADAPTRQVALGLTYPALPYAARLQPLLHPQGAALACTDGKTCHAVEADVANGPVEFAVGLNLTGLPPDLQDPETLNARLQLDAPHAKAELVPGSARALTATEHAHPALAAYTHVARVRVAGLFAPDVTLTLRLPAPPLPAWVSSLSTDDDTHPTALPGRTYHLDWILRGARQAYGATLPPLFECPIRLVKKT